MGFDDADRLTTQMVARSITAAEQAGAKVEARFYLMNRGRPGQTRRFAILPGPASPWARAASVLDAMFRLGDSAAAGRAEAEPAHSLDAPTPPLRAERERIRAELARLEGGARGG